MNKIKKRDNPSGIKRLAENSKKKHLATKFARHFSTIHRKGYSTIKPANVLIHNRVKVTDIQRRKALSRFNMVIFYALENVQRFLTVQSGQLYRNNIV